MSGVPKSQASQLIDELNAPDKSQIDLVRIKAAAAQLQKSDAFRASVVKGMIACLESDEAEMRYWHGNALKLQPNSEMALYNFAQSLRRMGCFHEAIGLYEKISKIGGAATDVHVAAHMRALSQVGRVRDAVRAAHLAKPAGQCVQAVIEELRAVVSAMDSRKTADKKLESLLNAAFGLLKADQSKVKEVKIKTSADGSNLIVLNIIVDLPSHKVAALNAELADYLAEKFDNPLTDVVVAIFRSVRRTSNERAAA